MRLEEAVKILNCDVVCGDDLLDREVITGCGCDLMSHVLAFVKNDNTLLLTGLTTPQTIFIADAVNVRAICFARGKRPSEEVVKLARARGMVLLASDLPLYEACGKLYKNGLSGYSENRDEE